MRNLPTTCKAQPTKQSGLSLIELMISLTIGVVLLIGITSLIVQQSNSRDELEKSSRQIENGRYAMQILYDAIQHAGFYGTFVPPLNAIYTTNDPCGNFTLNKDWDATNAVTSPVSIPMPIMGYTEATAPTLACLQNYLPGTSVLVTHHVDTVDTLNFKGNALEPGILPSAADGITSYLQISHCPTETAASPFKLAITNLNLTKRDCSAPAKILKYLVRIYYISSCNICAPSDNVPTLKMIENPMNLSPGQQPNPVPLVEGIEKMHFDYGLDTDIATGDGFPDVYVTDVDAAVANGLVSNLNNTVAKAWSDVMAIRINLLARNLDQTTGYTDTKTYCLTGTATPCPANRLVPAQNDQYKRHLYTQVARVVNAIGRRALK